VTPAVGLKRPVEKMSIFFGEPGENDYSIPNVPADGFDVSCVQLVLG
jgi:hypothetical protein